MKGDYLSAARALTKSLSSSTLEPHKARKEPVSRSVNELLGERRREQRRKDNALRLRTSNDEGSRHSGPPPSLAAADDDELLLRGGSSTIPVPMLPAPRRPAGPAPPKSWTTSTARSVPSSSSSFLRGKGKEREASFDAACAFFDGRVAGPSSQVEAQTGPPRLTHLCFKAISRQMSSTGGEEMEQDVAELPRHLREGLVWWLGKNLLGGLGENEARVLLWDLRDWGRDEPSAEDNEQETWEGGGVDDEDWWSSADSGWSTLSLPRSSLSLSTLRLLLLPLPTTPPSISPINSLSLAFLPHALLSQLVAVLPSHLRVLSLAGIRLLNVEGEGVGEAWWTDDRQSRAISLLAKLSRATPLLQILDLSDTIPPLRPFLLGSLPWSPTSGPPTWPALRTLALRGMDAPAGDGLRRVRETLRGRKGGWIDVLD